MLPAVVNRIWTSEFNGYGVANWFSGNFLQFYKQTHNCRKILLQDILRQKDFWLVFFETYYLEHFGSWPGKVHDVYVELKSDLVIVRESSSTLRHIPGSSTLSHLPIHEEYTQHSTELCSANPSLVYNPSTAPLWALAHLLWASMVLHDSNLCSKAS